MWAKADGTLNLGAIYEGGVKGGPNECHSPLGRLEGVVWSPVLHVCRHGSAPG